ncbi:protein commissureless 2 homolog [Bactrocera oleae]|uniref:protein commissureless 2 homolog n=1 Tax=Bactrocera oleae TaxID=104688 RepID=UPI0006B788DD|nr:protein commissureless 2 homolog [Bactrocera oleae]
MSELQVISTNYTTTSKDTLELFELPQNYSVLINKLERLALGLDSALGNLSLDRKEIEVAVGGSKEFLDPFSGPTAGGHLQPARSTYNHHETEIPLVVSDIWIGVILTLLIVSVIFFICSCFLYHKFQEWKNSYRTNPEPVEICRHFPPDYEVESLPSYTIVSGLPTYDDALEEFRKAGIILTSPMPVVKIFEKDPAVAGNSGKENQIFNMENGVSPDNDNVSVTSTCTCGAANNTNSNNPNSIYTVPSALAPQVIELSPEQLAALSQKRLSLQITFNNSVRRNSRPRGIDLYRQVNRNNLLRSQAVAAAAAARDGFPQIHRSSSTLALSNEPNMLDRHLMQHLQHRGSLY